MTGADPSPSAGPEAARPEAARPDPAAVVPEAASPPDAAPAPAAGPDAVAAQAAAVEWVAAVMDQGDMAKVWSLTHPTLRLVLVQQWILGYEGDPTVGPTEDWDALAAALAASPSRHPLWERFARERLDRWRQFWVGFNARTWKVADVPERVGSDLEVVSFVERKEGGDDKGPGGGRPVLARRLAVRRMPGGWKVAGLDGRVLYRPGWPPAPAGPAPVPPHQRRAGRGDQAAGGAEPAGPTGAAPGAAEG